MKKVNAIAIDGPAGSGKSTVAKEVAKRLGFLYVDTGAMYRALTFKAIDTGTDFTDEKALIGLSEKSDIELKNTGESLEVYLDKKDVTREIRTMEVTRKVKILASIGKIRENMVRLQRKMGEVSSGCVLEGRDIGTVVFPDAKNKFYLDGDFNVRVKRRFDELKARNLDVPVEEVENDLIARDTSDITRKVGPLKKADDAVVVDTTLMTAGEVVDKILSFIKK